MTQLVLLRLYLMVLVTGIPGAFPNMLDLRVQI
jgi:hypothetical protein